MSDCCMVEGIKAANNLRILASSEAVSEISQHEFMTRKRGPHEQQNGCTVGLGYVIPTGSPTVPGPVLLNNY